MSSWVEATVHGRRRSLPRRAMLAWSAAGATLLIAVVGGLQGRSLGLAMAVATASGGATDVLEAWGLVLPFGYAFIVGMAAAVNPCGIALLPSYVGLYLGTASSGNRSTSAQLGMALVVSACMTVSFVAFFSVIGLGLGLVGAALGVLLPWFSVAVGALLVLVGGRLLAGGSLDALGSVRLADRLGGAVATRSAVGYAAYGLTFAVSSLGCSLPFFLAVVGSAFARSGLVAGVGQMVWYALGMGAVISVLTLLTTLARRSAVSRAARTAGLLQPLSSAVLLATGGYIVYYWLSAGIQ